MQKLGCKLFQRQRCEARGHEGIIVNPRYMIRGGEWKRKRQQKYSWIDAEGGRVVLSAAADQISWSQWSGGNISDSTAIPLKECRFGLTSKHMCY
uniref:Uncharacterized protein n=1 Tax=Parascaris univalens TaxID=6257 RepID=A0A915BGM8_PARUN